MSVFGTTFNKFLTDYGKKLKPGSPEALAFAQASSTADQNSRADRILSPAVGAGGDAWNSFDQFHKVRKDMEAILGNKYSISGGSISGGGDLNEKNAGGFAMTRPVTASAPRSGGNTMTRSSQFGMAPVDPETGRNPYEAVDEYRDQSLQRRERELALQRLMEALRGDKIANTKADEAMSRFRDLPAEGSKAEYDRTEYGQARAIDMREQGQDVAASREARRFQFPEVRQQRDEMQRNAIDRASASASVAGASRERVAGMQTRAQMAIAAGRRPTAVEIVGDFMDELGKTYGTDPRTGAANLPPDVEQLRNSLVANSSALLRGGAGNGPTAALSPADQRFAENARSEGYSEEEIQAFLASRNIRQR